MRISYWSSDVCSSDLTSGYFPTSENFGRRIDVHPAAIGVRGLFHDESDGAGNVFRLKRRQELVPTGLAVRFHILEYLGTGCAGRNKSDLYRSEEHTSELQSLMRISYAVFCLKKKKNTSVEI